MSRIEAPTVSVLVPCYNQKRFLPETIKSVEAQTLTDWELIVVDDGSTDGSADIVRESRSCRGVFVQNRGASAARNQALLHARGRFIQYLDADDVLEPDALATRVEALQRTGADIAYGDVRRWEETTKGDFAQGSLVCSVLANYASQDDVALIRGFWRPPAGLLYSRRIVDAIGPWREDLPVAEDARYMIDAALAGARFVHVAGVSALYRITMSPSLSRVDPRTFVTCVMRNADEIQARWRQSGQLNDEQGLALAETYAFAARSSFRHDPLIFEAALSRLRALRRFRVARWPILAATLQRLVGRSAALRALELVGRPAPNWELAGEWLR